jgi:hypothetical protein
LLRRQIERRAATRRTGVGVAADVSRRTEGSIEEILARVLHHRLLDCPLQGSRQSTRHDGSLLEVVSQRMPRPARSQ